jgi:hypothetical protein
MIYVAITGDVSYGLRYPIIVALMRVVIGAFFLVGNGVAP